MGNLGQNTARAVRMVVLLVAIACFLFGGVLAGAYLAVRHIVTTAAVDYARALGVALTPAEVRFGINFIQLLDSKCSALEVPGVTASVRRIDVDLASLRPAKILLSGIAVEARGDPILLQESALRYWERVRPKVSIRPGAAALPKLEWQHLALSVVTGNAFVPTVAVTELTIASGVGPTQDETAIRTASTQLGPIDLGPLAVAFRLQSEGFELGWGPTLLESKWRVVYRGLPAGDQVRFSFQPEGASTLLAQVGMEAPAGLAVAKLSGHLEALRDRVSGKTSGTAAFTLSGFTPPFPAELKGYRFADTTILRAQFEIDPLWFAADLRGIELKTGDLSLVGHGRIDRELFSARLRAELTGALDCVTLARGYSLDDVGGELGKWGAKNAPKAIRGAVSVKVQIDADSSRLRDAKVVKRIGIGCGLRPMSVVDFLNLGLPPLPDRQTVERMLQRLPPEKVIANLTALPQLLPTLDEMLEVTTRNGSASRPTVKRATAKPNATNATNAPRGTAGATHAPTK